MVYHGHVLNGIIVLDEPVALPEGAAVEVVVSISPLTTNRSDTAKTLEDEIAAIAAGVPKEDWGRLPADLGDQIDHYLYGTPKR
jgi:predicted DNA-binding antitoxin AbrB/MazE fold protein